MKKNCENHLEQFYSLDKQERIPLGLSVHLLLCRECRSVVRNLTKAEKILGEKSTQPSPENSKIISSVLKGIKSSNLDYHGHHEEKNFSPQMGGFRFHTSALYSTDDPAYGH